MGADFDIELFEYVSSIQFAPTTTAAYVGRLDSGFVYLLATNAPIYFRTDDGAASAGNSSHLLKSWVPLPGNDQRLSTIVLSATTATVATLSKLRKVCV